MIKSTWKNAKDMFQSAKYGIASNDCSLLQKAIAGTNVSSYEAKCSPATSLAWQNVQNLTLQHFQVSMPPSLLQKESELVLGYIHVINNGLVTENGDILTGSSDIRILRCKENLYHTPEMIYQETDKTIPHFKEVFTISQYWGDGFFHYMVEDLPRLMPYLEFLTKFESIMIHVNSRNGFTKSIIMKYIGILESRLVTGHVQADIVYSPGGSSCGHVSLLNAHYQSLFFRNTLHSFPSKIQDVIVLIRRSDRRWFNYHSSILLSLEKLALRYGLKVKVLSDIHLPSLEETIGMFNRAFIVVAPHGAGNSNLMFSESGTVLVEGLCDPINLCYTRLSVNLAHRYYGIVYPATNKTCFEFTKSDVLPPVCKAVEMLKGVVVDPMLCSAISLYVLNI